jgi:GAF domain-containing protein
MLRFQYSAISRLTTLSLLIICIFLLFGFYVISAINQIQDYNALNYRLDNILYHTNQCRIAKEEFLLGAYTDENFVMKGTNASYEAFHKAKDSIVTQINMLAASNIMKNLNLSENVKNIQLDFVAYDNLFVQIAHMMKEKGFKDLGLEGKMRTAIHFIENAPAGINKVRLLTLRRHEKDFILRKDFQYVEKFRQEIVKFEEEINHLTVSDEEKKNLANALASYKDNFDRLVTIEQQIGFKAGEGIRSQLAQKYSVLENNLKYVQRQLNIATQKKNREVNFNIVLLFLIVMIGFIWALRFLMLSVARPIAELRVAADQISNGDLKVNVESVKSSKILIRLIESFGKIVKKLKTVMEQIEQISSRKIREELPMADENDEVTKTLNKIIRELRSFDEGEAKRTWYNQSLARFADTLRFNQNESGVNVYDNIIRDFIKILEANQGALFAVENNTETHESYLTMKACYAYDRKKFINKQIFPGEGLAGQVWQEGEPVLLTDIPDDYVAIKSGLGGSNPSCVIIVPLKINEQIVGILELASFKIFEEHHIQWIEAVAENVAAFIQNIKVNEKTTVLLENSEILARQLKAQEEELRQNMEEMQATQEEMKRKETELEKEIQKLKQEKRQFEPVSLN